MPVFVLNGSAKPEFNALPEIVQGFITAMFFTEASNGFSMEDWHTVETQEALEMGETDGQLPSDCGFDELHPDSLTDIVKFCEAFEQEAGDLLEPIRNGEIDDYDMDRVGNDLWYTSQGHGVGFWDREELDLQGDDKEEYERLTDIMVASGAKTPAWESALAERNKLVSLGNKLSDLCRYREAQVWFGDHTVNGNAPFVYCEISF